MKKRNRQAPEPRVQEPTEEGKSSEEGMRQGRRLSRRDLLRNTGIASLGAAFGYGSVFAGQNGQMGGGLTSDYQLPDTGVVPEDAAPDRSFRIVSNEQRVTIDEGIVYEAMTFDETIPSTQHVMQEGEIIDVELVNEGRVTHGLSYHPAYRSTAPVMSDVPPGESRSEKFRATYPGVFMYHCAPGGQGIPVHTLGGMYGMAIVEPTTRRYPMEEKLGREPDVKIHLAQHEIYASGLDAIRGEPLYCMFNGYNYRYFEEPIVTRPGDYVRIYYLNVGPNYASSLHLVGGIWDYMYYQGNPNNVLVGGQSVVSGPTDSWVIDFRVPEEGTYLLVSHTFGTQTMRGSIGVIVAEEGAERTQISSEGPSLPVPEEPRRVVNTFGPGSEDIDPVYTPHANERAWVQMVGNSFVPKRIRVAPGTPITWINEDVFDALGAEQTGAHNVVVTDGPEAFASPMLGHAETWQHAPTAPGEYEYICAVHPYMIGRIIVDPDLEQ